MVTDELLQNYSRIKSVGVGASENLIRSRDVESDMLKLAREGKFAELERMTQHMVTKDKAVLEAIKSSATRKISVSEYLKWGIDAPMNVWMAPYNFAWQGSTYCRALRKVGINCIMSEWNPHPFGQVSDIVQRTACHTKDCWAKVRAVTTVFFFHEHNCPFEGILDFAQYREEGKCVIFYSHGTMYRPCDKCELFQRPYEPKNNAMNLRLSCLPYCWYCFFVSLFVPLFFFFL